jgi:acyl dehydratase
MTEATAKDKKEARYELIEIPEPFGPVELVVDEEKVKAFAFAVDDYGDWYLGSSSPFGNAIGHPLLLANDLLFLFYENYDGNTARGLHTHERLEFCAPVFRGEKVTISGAYVDRYMRRGQGYVVLEAVAQGEDGRDLVRHRGIEIMRAHAGSVVGRRSAAKPSGGRVTLEVAAGVPAAKRARAGLAPRTPIASLTKHVTQGQMYIFSWGARGFRNVHTDPESAASSGLDRTLVQAQQQVSFVTEAMVRFFGPRWLTSGELDMRFVAPAFVDDRLTVEGAVLGEVETRHGPGLELEIWVRRQDGTPTGIGWSTAALESNAGGNTHAEQGAGG